MSYRFLPWTRQGLATRITDADLLGTSIPARARLPVRVALSTGETPSVELRLHGPGDVIGLDPRSIVRVDPPRFTANAAANVFAAIEFDPPDLPWMFSPARAGSQERLRPWLVLVVVARQEGVAVSVARDRPLPQLAIEPPAVPGVELPDLSESWAWAHVQTVESAPPASLPGYLRDHPDRNVSRIVCPRRLEPDRDYFACLVPAFETGRLAGLGQPVPETPTTQAAWGAAGSVGASIRLPLYFHWEFRTGPAGDFESLARRLTPRPVPDTVGFRRMFIGDAHPALPSLEPDAGGIVKLEGALRAPEAGTGEELGPEHDEYVGALVDVLNAPADHVVEGASPGAEAVAPPIHGGAHVGVERLDGTEHRWLGELNTDPRHRAAAGLGAEIVRQNQERYMHAAWEQVGDVLRANALLDLARFMREAMARVHRRHVAPLREEALLAFTAPVHVRVPAAARSMARLIDASTLPSGVVDPSFRRMASPRSPVLRRAARVAGREAPEAATVDVVGELAAGEREFDILARVPDGLVGSRLLEELPRRARGRVGEELGAPATVAAEDIVAARELTAELEGSPVPAERALRPDLAISGLILEDHVGALREAGGRRDLIGTIGSVLERARRTPDARGMALRTDDRGVVEAELLEGGGLTAHRGPRARTSALEAREPPGRPDIRGLPARPSEGGPAAPALPVDPEGRPVARPPVRDPVVVDRFTAAFRAHREALEVAVESVIPPPEPLDLAGAKDTLVAAIDPRPVIDARARLAVRIGDRALADGLLPGRLRQEEPLDPIMVGPLLPEPLYAALAAYDPDRFLPGIGEIPPDTVTMLETNSRFVEAFLIGANHEMNRELLWRRFPTDRRGTPFRRFWERVDGSDDIGPIHAIARNLRLGTTAGADLRGSLTLLVRGQLLRRFPDAVVYAVPALSDGTLDRAPDTVRNPIFWGRLDPDVTFAGFDLTREDVEAAPGWFFVIAEQPVEARFGLDVPPVGGSPPLASWSDLDWDHVGVLPGGHLRLAESGLVGQEREVVPAGARATFGRNAAHMGAICFQRPFRAAIHTSDVIEGAEGPEGARVRPVLTHAVLLRPLLLDGGG